MALGWLNKLTHFVTRAKDSPIGDRVSELRDAIGRETRARPEHSEPTPAPTWSDSALDGVPMAMVIVGLVLAACTELIRVWAILGYLLIVVAPVVYWLRRIEKRLIDLSRFNRQR